jgi:hypothetical protein
MGRLQAAKRELDSLGAELDTLLGVSESNGHASAGRVLVVREQTAKAAAALDGLLRQVQELGVEVKGIEQGLVDFPSLREGRLVYLCWQAGEDRVMYWHDLDAGFAGRQPL